MSDIYFEDLEKSLENIYLGDYGLNLKMVKEDALRIKNLYYDPDIEIRKMLLFFFPSLLVFDGDFSIGRFEYLEKRYRIGFLLDVKEKRVCQDLIDMSGTSIETAIKRISEYAQDTWNSSNHRHAPFIDSVFALMPSLMADKDGRSMFNVYEYFTNKNEVDRIVFSR